MSDSITDKVTKLEAEVKELQEQLDFYRKLLRRAQEENTILRWKLKKAQEE